MACDFDYWKLVMFNIVKFSIVLLSVVCFYNLDAMRKEKEKNNHASLSLDVVPF